MIKFLFVLCVPIFCTADFNISEQHASVEWIPHTNYKTIQRLIADPKMVASVELEGSSDGEIWPIYIARGIHLDGKIPGKLWKKRLHLYMGYDGKELLTNKFEILSYPPGVLEWIPIDAGRDTLPENLLEAGTEPVTHETLYVCRALHNDQIPTLGKFCAKRMQCLVPYYGKEFSHVKFEALAFITPQSNRVQKTHDHFDHCAVLHWIFWLLVITLMVILIAVAVMYVISRSNRLTNFFHKF